jgi:cytochrome c biogenesis factor
LQGFFLVGSVIAVMSHALASNPTQDVVNNFILSLLAIGLGLLVGLRLDKYLTQMFSAKFTGRLIFANIYIISEKDHTP